MTFRRALFQELEALAMVVFADVRVFPLGATPTGRLPDRYVTWNRVSVIHERHLQAGSGMARDRFDINCWARRLSDAEDLADAFREQLDNLRGRIGVEDKFDVQGTFLQDEDHEFVPSADGSSGGFHRVRADLLFVHPETVSPI